MASTNQKLSEVVMEVKGCVRIFMLNRPKRLNALSPTMGNGRAFCYGGDVAAILRDIEQGNWKKHANHYRMMHSMNYVMATYSKPQVSILDGIVMGQGAGISLHGSFCVVTENSVFALPETALGVFPDFGSSCFLSRLPRFFGEYLVLTGAMLDGAEMLACGLATHFVPSERLPLLEKALVKADSSDPAVISSTIEKFSDTPAWKRSSAFHGLNIINKCFSGRTVEDIVAALETEAADKNNDWITSTIQSLKKASPTSLKISLRSIREGRLQSIDECLVREFRMVCHAMFGEVSKDSIEGLRSILFNANKNPKWKPSKLESISNEMVDLYFSKVDNDDWEDLKLPVRPNLSAYTTSKL